MGSQNYEIAGDTFEATDTAHTVEAHLRIEDEATRTYGKGWIAAPPPSTAISPARSIVAASPMARSAMAAPTSD